jgi:hypothetical protein
MYSCNIHDPRQLEKQRSAIALVMSLDEPVLLWQVACEMIGSVKIVNPFKGL